MKKDNWNNNIIQFPRLISELNAVGLDEINWKDLCESMGLEKDQIQELIDRAEKEWIRIKYGEDGIFKGRT